MPTVPGWVYLFSRGRAAQICVAGRSGHRGRAVTCPLHGPRFSRLGDVIHVYRPPWFCELNPDCEETSPKACFFGSPQYVVIGKSAAGTLHLRTGEKRRSDIENTPALGGSWAVTQGHANARGVWRVRSSSPPPHQLRSEIQDSWPDSKGNQAGAGACSQGQESLSTGGAVG